MEETLAKIKLRKDSKISYQYAPKGHTTVVRNFQSWFRRPNTAIRSKEIQFISHI